MISLTWPCSIPVSDANTLTINFTPSLVAHWQVLIHGVLKPIWGKLPLSKHCYLSIYQALLEPEGTLEYAHGYLCIWRGRRGLTFQVEWEINFLKLGISRFSTFNAGGEKLWRRIPADDNAHLQSFFFIQAGILSLKSSAKPGISRLSHRRLFLTDTTLMRFEW